MQIVINWQLFQSPRKRGSTPFQQAPFGRDFSHIPKADKQLISLTGIGSAPDELSVLVSLTRA